MPKFFSNKIYNDIIDIDGDDAKHICKVLRMSVGEKVTVCDLKGNDYNCVIKSITPSLVKLGVVSMSKSLGEPNFEIILYQGFPKGDKFEFIIQKSVELGVRQIVPVIMNRCVSRPDKKTQNNKIERYNRIALEAAKQSGRGIIPIVSDFCSYKQALDDMSANDLSILFYENDKTPLFDILSNEKDMKKKDVKTVSIMIGPEGGFDDDEIELALSKGLKTASMGPRILRCETAPLYALSVITFQLEQCHHQV